MDRNSILVIGHDLQRRDQLDPAKSASISFSPFHRCLLLIRKHHSFMLRALCCTGAKSRVSYDLIFSVE